MQTASEVGGDYYDVINVGEKNWLVIGDVSGHGVPAGLVMIMVQTAINYALKHLKGASPDRVLTTVNDIIFKNIQKLSESKYMTLTLMSVETDGTIHYSGLHQDIMVYRSAAKSVERIETQGFWLGATDDIEGMNKVDKLCLETGDTMLLFTDGIVEAEDTSGELYGSKKLEGIFEKQGDQPTDTIKDQIIESLEGHNCSDDVTLLVVKRG